MLIWIRKQYLFSSVLSPRQCSDNWVTNYSIYGIYLVKQIINDNILYISVINIQKVWFLNIWNEIKIE